MAPKITTLEKSKTFSVPDKSSTKNVLAAPISGNCETKTAPSTPGRLSASALYEKYALWQVCNGYRFFRSLGQGPSDRVFDFGCGTGALTKLISESVNHVVGVDPDQIRIETAKELYKTNISFFHRKSSLESLTVATNGAFATCNSFFSNYVIHWINDQDLKRDFAEMYQSLPNFGILAIQTTEYLPHAIVALTDLLVDKNAANSIKNNFYWRSLEKTIEMVEAAGFSVLRARKIPKLDVYDDLDTFKLWWEGTTHGAFKGDEMIGKDTRDYRKFIADYVDTENGSVTVHEPNFQLVIWKKI